MKIGVKNQNIFQKNKKNIFNSYEIKAEQNRQIKAKS